MIPYYWPSITGQRQYDGRPCEDVAHSLLYRDTFARHVRAQAHVQGWRPSHEEWQARNELWAGLGMRL